MINVDKKFYNEDNYYNSDLYGMYKEDIKNYIFNYKREDYNEILKKDKRTRIYEIFSTSRTNIIKCLDDDKEKRVLEIGSNYGEITQELVEKYKYVTAMEFSNEKIECIKKRLDDKTNLDCILVTKLNSIQLDKKYDYIFLIGSAEYAKCLGFKSFSEMIFWCLNHLSSVGKIIIAIDNKFGVKYLAGTTRNSEEVPFANFKSYISKNYELFGKNELIDMFNSAKVNYKFLYPVPNYKLTHLIYTDSYLPKQNKYNIYYDENEEILFNELTFLQEVDKNKQFDIFTNSYLIELTNSGKFSDIRYVNFSNIRKEEYKIFTKITDNCVEKEYYALAAKKHIQNINENIEKLNTLGVYVCDKFQNDKIISEYIDMYTLDAYINNLGKNREYEKIKNEIDKWYNFLKEKLKITNSKTNIFKKFNVEIKEELENKLTILENRIFRFNISKCIL